MAIKVASQSADGTPFLDLSGNVVAVIPGQMRPRGSTSRSHTPQSTSLLRLLLQMIQ